VKTLTHPRKPAWCESLGHDEDPDRCEHASGSRFTPATGGGWTSGGSGTAIFPGVDTIIWLNENGETVIGLLVTDPTVDDGCRDFQQLALRPYEARLLAGQLSALLEKISEASR